MTDENVGKTIGIYRILGVCNQRAADGHLKYHVECIYCGFTTDMKLSNIKQPKTCKHNQTKWNNERIGKIFHNMKRRCYNKQSKDYRFYGGKQIEICEEWLSNPLEFEKWAMENGYDDHLTIDRINSNKNYEPSNCRWIPGDENSKIKASTSLINVDGVVHTGRDWAKILNIGTNIINTYIRQHGIDNVIQFIRLFQKYPLLERKSNQSYYDVYMNYCE